MAGRVNTAPATITPLQAPIDWMMTFWPRALRFLKALLRPTAMMAMGMAASNTWPTFRPRYAAAAEKIMVIRIPMVTDHTVASGYFFLGDINGVYSSPSSNFRYAFSGRDVLMFSESFIVLQR